MEDWTKFSDDKVFTKVGEDPGSRAAYWRDTEIRRREYLLNKALLRTQSAAVEAQRNATAIMERQSQILVWTAGFAALSAFASLATAVVTYIVAK
jgi:hypothetical protein